MTAATMTLHTQETIKALLETSNKAVEKALLTLYARQTMDEQATQPTSHVNGRGFSAFDAEILSSFACWIERKQAQKVELGKCLTEKQMILARKKVVRYAKQLAEVANEKASPKVEVKEESKPEVKTYLPIAEDFSLKALDVLEGLYGLDYTTDIAKKAVADESVRVTSYYDGRPILSILKDKLAELEARKEAPSKPVDGWSDPEHRAFRVAQDKISKWIAR